MSLALIAAIARSTHLTFCSEIRGHLPANCAFSSVAGDGGYVVMTSPATSPTPRAPRLGGLVGGRGRTLPERRARREAWRSRSSTGRPRRRCESHYYCRADELERGSTSW